MLSADQLSALRYVEDGHNLAILGQAGTGKTYLVQYILRVLQQKGRNVCVTASTGIAASQYKDGRTIHSWCGIDDGRYNKKEAVERLKTKPELVQRIQDADLLIIDEISMLSGKLFDQVEYVTRACRQQEKSFGGLQVVCVGDFYQLPPIPNALYNDPGLYAFETVTWKTTMQHKLILNSVIRQSDSTLIRAINELELGEQSNETTTFLRSLERPLPADSKPVILYGTNFEVDWHNADAVAQMEGELCKYVSIDSGAQSLLRRVQAKKTLSLRKGCPIILLKNLSTKLVNGCRGKVLEMAKDSVTCSFDGDIVNLNRQSFTVYDAERRCILAQRLQIPISLAFALTVHKAQGLTLQTCEIHCENITQAGQMGVAVGRVKSVEGLRVVGYNPKQCVRHKQTVKDYYDAPCTFFPDDLSCCNKIPDQAPPIQCVDTVFDLSDDSDFDETELQLIQELEALFTGLEAPAHDDVVEHFDISAAGTLFDSLKSAYTITKEQQDLNACLNRFHNDPKAKVFLNRQYEKVLSFLPTHKDANVLSVQDWSKFLSSYQAHISSDDYVKSCALLFHPAPVHYLTCGHIMTALRKRAASSAKTQIDSEVKELLIKSSEICQSAHGKIRYVGGRCLAKVKHRHMNIVRRAIDKGCHGDVEILKHKKSIDLLQAMTTSQGAIIQETEYPKSLVDVLRRQNLTCGLTNISDASFEFFLLLEKERLLLYNQFTIHGENILLHVQKSLLNNENLLRNWCKLISSTGVLKSSNIADDCILKETLGEILKSYLSVTDSEFRRNLLGEMGRKKAMEHRKKVLTQKSKTDVSSSFTVSWQSIEDDDSPNKEISHLKLKCLVMEGKTSLMKFTRHQLVSLGKLYNLCLSGKKNTIVDTLAAKIQSSSSMDTISSHGESSSAPGASTEVSQPKRSSGKSSQRMKHTKKTDDPVIKTKKRRHMVVEKDNVFCGTCEDLYGDDDEPWIMCSYCQTWFHRTCSALNQVLWDMFTSNDNAMWKCPLCEKKS